jgi:hypothetical protein
VIVGYALLGLSLLLVVLYIIFFVVVLGVAGSASHFNFSDFG